MHLAQNERGTWTAIVQVNGRRRKVTRRTKADARREALKLELALGGAPRRHLTVTELLTDWQTSNPMSHTFRADAERIITALPATFTARDVDTVTPRTVEQLHATLADQGLTPHRVRRAHEVLSSAWTLAMRWEAADTNPFAKVPKPAVTRRSDTTPTVDDVRAILTAAEPNPRLHLFLVLAAVTGARRGELCGLRWAQHHGDTLTIGAAVAYTPQAGVHQTDGKIGSAGWRTVALEPDLAAALDTHHAEQRTLAAESQLADPVWIFSHNAGQDPWRPDYATHEFGKIRSRLGLRHVRLHDLRHFSATQLLAAGTPIHVVSKRLGHRQESTTSGRYGHQVPAAERAAAAELTRMIGGS